MTDERADGIKEDSSKNKKRGRPRIHPEEMIRDVLKMQQAKTPRGAVEHLLMCSTFYLITEAWRADPAGNAWAEYYLGEVGKGPMRHKSIMAALGRIDDRADMIRTARFIAEQNPKTKNAVALLRCVRLGREVQPDFVGLYEHFARALDDYLIGHPSTPTEMQARALRELADSVEEHELQKEGQTS